VPPLVFEIHAFENVIITAIVSLYSNDKNTNKKSLKKYKYKYITKQFHNSQVVKKVKKFNLGQKVELQNCSKLLLNDVEKTIVYFKHHLLITRMHHIGASLRCHFLCFVLFL